MRRSSVAKEVYDVLNKIGKNEPIYKHAVAKKTGLTYKQLSYSFETGVINGGLLFIKSTGAYFRLKDLKVRGYRKRPVEKPGAFNDFNEAWYKFAYGITS